MEKRFMCPNYDFGCSSQEKYAFKYQEALDHLAKCVNYDCPFACGAKLVGENTDKHFSSCPNAPE